MAEESWSSSFGDVRGHGRLERGWTEQRGFMRRKRFFVCSSQYFAFYDEIFVFSVNMLVL